MKTVIRKIDRLRSERHVRTCLPAVTIERGDNLIILSALLLSAIGLVMVYSASPFVSMRYGKVDWYYFSRQLLFTVFGLGAMIFGARLDLNFYRRWVKLMLMGVSLLMFLQLFTPLGRSIGGTRRWIDLGFFNFQTSEAARCIIIIYLARVAAEKPEILQKLDRQLFAVLGLVAVPILLTVLQPDLSGALVLSAIAGLVLFLGGLRLKHILLFASSGFTLAVLWVLRTPYQRERVTNFMLRITDGGGGDNYQTLQSLFGFGRGGLFGVGLGQSKQKMLFLPEPHTDFIFSIIGEELGMIRTLLVLALFLVLALRSIKMLKSQSDRFSYLLGAGLIGSIVLYALINMYVATGLLPVTGLPLPFISSGGTNLVFSLWSVGVLWQLSRRTRGYE